MRPEQCPGRTSVPLLLRIQFDDELLRNFLRNQVTRRHVGELAHHVFAVPLKPRELTSITHGQRSRDSFERLRLLTHANEVAGTKFVRRNVYYFTVYRDVLVRYQLAGSTTR